MLYCLFCGFDHYLDLMDHPTKCLGDYSCLDHKKPCHIAHVRPDEPPATILQLHEFVPGLAVVYGCSSLRLYRTHQFDMILDLVSTWDRGWIASTGLSEFIAMSRVDVFCRLATQLRDHC